MSEAGHPLRSVLLVGNYASDRQESMLRFSGMLQAGLVERGMDCATIAPQPRWSRLSGRYRHGGLSKWLGYADKYISFPRALRKVLGQKPRRTVVHIVDHSNAMYTACMGGRPHVVTCHDLLAVRGALGEDTDCPASFMGRRLQRWILNGLRQSQHIACDSVTTEKDVLRLLPERRRSDTTMIPVGLNYEYKVLAPAETARRLREAGIDVSRPYLFHVGSNLPRKNKPAILRAVALAGARFTGDIVFAGPALDPALRALAVSLGLAGRIREVAGPGNDLLEALYNGAYALMFPSRWEGFGWPIVEAQACGCPVICGDQSSLPEVAGKGALLCPPDDYNALAEALLIPGDPGRRSALILAGLENVRLYQSRLMIDRYLDLYTRLAI